MLCIEEKNPVPSWVCKMIWPVILKCTLFMDIIACIMVWYNYCPVRAQIISVCILWFRFLEMNCLFFIFISWYVIDVTWFTFDGLCSFQYFHNQMWLSLLSVICAHIISVQRGKACVCLGERIWLHIIQSVEVGCNRRQHLCLEGQDTLYLHLVSTLYFFTRLDQ